jgi:hypothetical protein
MTGNGWNCSANACSRSDALAGGSAYPAITVTVNVAANATSPQVNQVSVSGGGSAGSSASDVTSIVNTSTDLTLDNLTLSSGVVVYQAINSITAINVTVNADADVTFKAGNFIDLKPGFRATAGTAGTTFHAFIGN